MFLSMQHKTINKIRIFQGGAKNNADKERKKIRINSHMKKVSTKEDDAMGRTKSCREAELEEKLTALSAEYERLKSSMVSTEQPPVFIVFNQRVCLLCIVSRNACMAGFKTLSFYWSLIL